jgi:type V secretory pathway adhesin AidA
MSAPTSDMPPGTTTGASAEHRRRRAPLVLAVSGLAVVAIAVGASLAVATRPIARPAPAAAGAVPPTIATEQGAAEPAARPESSAASAAAATPALEDGDHDAYITKVDGANDRIVVDVVQVFNDDEAVKAAIADGESPAEARYRTGWVRNENPRLRTLPLAADLKVDLLGTCEESGSDREAVLTRLADNAKRKGNYYFMLTVSDGTVQQIQERLAINAC